MSRIHAMGRVVYWSAGALVVLNCIPHTLPGILKKRCALHCTHTMHTRTMHTRTMHTRTMHTLTQAHSHNAHTLTQCTHTHTMHTHSHNAHSHNAHTVTQCTAMSSKTRLRQRNWWLMFAELQPLWCVHLPQVGVAAATI